MNPALVLAHNNLNLTSLCVESLLKQDIPVTVFLFDNGSTDGTQEWASTQPDVRYFRSDVNLGFSKGVNDGMMWVFSTLDENGNHPQWCLIPNNDTILPSAYYRTLLELDVPVVSGVQHVDGHRVTMEDLEMVPPVTPLKPNPYFSALLFRKWAWDALGGFDESMRNYCSDCDMHVRAHLLGIGMFHAQIPFFHFGSATVRNASEDARKTLDRFQSGDWPRFHQKWGCDPGTPQYAAMFNPSLFGIQKESH